MKKIILTILGLGILFTAVIPIKSCVAASNEVTHVKTDSFSRVFEFNPFVKSIGFININRNIKLAAVRENEERKEKVKEIAPEEKEEEETTIEPIKQDYYELTVEATAYTAYCNGCSGITKTGIDLRSNPNLKVIAVDPNVIPLGSKVWVEGYGEAVAGDTGGAIKGNKIDVFISTKKEAFAWGRKQVKIKVYN